MSSTRKAKPALTDRSNLEAKQWSYTDTTMQTLPPLPADREDLAYYVRHHLNQTERLLIMLRYAEDLEFDEIAGVLDMAGDEVEEMHQLIVGRLKESLHACEAFAGA